MDMNVCLDLLLYCKKKGYSELLITQTSLPESIKMHIELEMDIISQFKMQTDIRQMQFSVI